VAGAALVAAAATAVSGRVQPHDAAREVVERWERSWNTYDLDNVDALFVPDSTVTYFSSERDGLIQGIVALREHHRRFGFVPGGKASEARLWLEDLVVRWRGEVATVLATWRFRRADGSAQAGPVTMILVPQSGGYRIAHMHFANGVGARR
jgi:ketosteroid isomerase-like protein